MRDGGLLGLITAALAPASKREPLEELQDRRDADADELKRPVSGRRQT